MHVEEFHAADLFELLLHPASGFQGVLQAAAHGFLVVILFGVTAIKKGGLDEATLAASVRKATSSDEAARTLTALLTRFITTPGRIRLEEVHRDEVACPICFMAIAQGDLARMNDATFVHQHSCGSLLVREIDS
ncbi:MAG: hypothetical protein AB7O38_14610 [Pirellulaceae bacterium]